MTTFKSDGTLTQIDTVSVNGQVVADFNHPLANGTYNVNSTARGLSQSISRTAGPR